MKYLLNNGHIFNETIDTFNQLYLTYAKFD